MGLFSMRKKSASTEQLAIERKEVVFVYRGGDLGMTLQKSKAKWLDSVGPTRIKWLKHQKLGITFTETTEGTIAIKHFDRAIRQRDNVWTGQELIAVNGLPVAGMDFESIMHLLQSTTSSVCTLDFTPPPTPIRVCTITNTAAKVAGVDNGMVLKAVNGVNIAGVGLVEVQKLLRGTSTSHPTILTFLPYADFVSIANGSDSSLSNMKTHLRNTVCLATVSVVAAFSA